MINKTYEEDSCELGRIASWLEDFAATDHDSTYLCFLRLLADYRHLQAQVMDNAVEREEMREVKL
jgi:hypothetical protein